MKTATINTIKKIWGIAKEYGLWLIKNAKLIVAFVSAVLVVSHTGLTADTITALADSAYNLVIGQ